MAPLDQRAPARRGGPGEFTFVALATAGIGVLAMGNVMASGEPALALLAAVTFAVLIVGVIGSVLALRGLTVEVVAPSDAEVGREVALGLALRGGVRAHCQVRVLDPPSAWHDAHLGDAGELRWLPPRRGVWEQLRLEVRTAWPFGVFQRRTTVIVPLSAPLHVVPRPVAVGVAGATFDDEGLRPIAAVTGGDLVRSVRPYRAGDPPKWVHWPTTARRGELFVREHEPVTVHDVTLRLTLGSDVPAAETAAARAMGAGTAVLGSGRGLVLATVDHRTGGLVAPVRTRRELGRRLARAVPGAPPTIGDPGVVEIS